MAPFNRPGRQRVTPKLTFQGRGTIRAALFDLGIYPAAVPTDDNSVVWGEVYETRDRKSTRLNSSHSQISYAVFCLKKTTITCTSSWTRPLRLRQRVGPTSCSMS